ncbi:MAG: hypothetical protein JST00_41810 [Deltaproteobacteria bacterium]|nr:hypothetical protein [Deltaproteobacteria bacterium]
MPTPPFDALRRRFRTWPRLLLSAATCTAAAATLLVPAVARAEDLNGLGSKTQLVLSADRLFPFFSFSRASVTSVENNQTRTTAESGASFGFFLGEEPALGAVHTIPRVAFDAVIVKGFTAGGSFAIALGLSHKQSEETIRNDNGVTTTVNRNPPRENIVGFAPRFGYIIPFTQAFGFWPRLGFAVYSRSRKQDIVDNNNTVIGAQTDSDTILSLDVDPQFLITPVEHVFFHFGPIFNVPLTGSRSSEDARGASTRTTSSDLAVFHFGISVGLGVWF